MLEGHKLQGDSLNQEQVLDQNLNSASKSNNHASVIDSGQVSLESAEFSRTTDNTFFTACQKISENFPYFLDSVVRAASDVPGHLMAVGEYLLLDSKQGDRVLQGALKQSSELIVALVNLEKDLQFFPMPLGAKDCCINAIHKVLSYFTEARDHDFELYRSLVADLENALAGVNHFRIAGSMLSCVGKDGSNLSLPLDALLAITGARGIIFDVDETLVASEAVHRELWEVALGEWDRLAPKNNQAADLMPCLFQELDRFYSNGGAATLVPIFFKEAKRRSALPQGINSVQELDDWLSELKRPGIERACREGRIRLRRGVERLLREARDPARNLLIGFNTRASRITTDPMMSVVIGDSNGNPGGFDEFFPPQYRIYGPELSVGKPDPLTWRTGADRMGLKPSEVIVVDDSPLPLLEAARARSRYNHDDHFAAVVGLYHDSSQLDDWAGFIEGQDCDPDVFRILIKNLRHLTI